VFVATEIEVDVCFGGCFRMKPGGIGGIPGLGQGLGPGLGCR
jgi:hypothetical protein